MIRKLVSVLRGGVKAVPIRGIDLSDVSIVPLTLLPLNLAPLESAAPIDAWLSLWRPQDSSTTSCASREAAAGRPCTPTPAERRMACRGASTRTCSAPPTSCRGTRRQVRLLGPQGPVVGMEWQLRVVALIRSRLRIRQSPSPSLARRHSPSRSASVASLCPPTTAPAGGFPSALRQPPPWATHSDGPGAPSMAAELAGPEACPSQRRAGRHG